MKNELWGRGMVIGLLVLVVCLLFGVALAINPGWPVVLAFVPGHKEPVDYVNLASAVGTVGAMVVALWVALHQAGLKRRDEMTRASLVAVGMLTRLKSVSNELDHILTWLSHINQNGVEDRVLEFREIQTYLASGYFKPARDDLLALVPLPNSASFRIAQAYDVLAWAEGMMCAEGKFEAGFLAASERRQHVLMERIRDQLQTARDYLRAALRDCEKAAALNMRYPSVDELFPPRGK